MDLRLLITRLSVAAFGAQVAMSWPLWYSKAGRTFPLLPLWGAAHTPAWHWVEILAMVLGAMAGLGALWRPRCRWWLGALVLSLVVLVCYDLSRLQVWLYFYLLVWAALLAPKDEAIPALGLLLTGVYAWGGLHKLTPYFAEENFPWFCQAFSWLRPLGHYPALGYAVAAGEALLAAGLLWRPARGLFRHLAVAFHLFIIGALSPLGLGWNTVIIPWNIAMGSMVWWVFSQKNDLAGSVFFQKTKTSVVVAGVAVVVWVLPALNVLGAWPEVLSWKMYTNTQPEAGFALSSADALCPHLRPIWQRHAWGERPERLLFDDWAMDNLGVPMFNSRRAHRQLAQYLCSCTHEASSAALWRLEVRPWRRSAEQWEELLCPNLK